MKEDNIFYNGLAIVGFFCIMYFIFSPRVNEAKISERACKDGVREYLNDNHREYFAEKISVDDLCSYIHAARENVIESVYAPDEN